MKVLKLVQIKRFCIVALLFFYLSLCFGQITYTSPITMHLSAGEIETINRIITIDRQYLPISIETEGGKDIQKLLVRSLGQNHYLNVGLCDIVVCSSADGLYKIELVLPATSKVEFIDVLQPPQYGQREKHYRFLVD